MHDASRLRLPLWLLNGLALLCLVVATRPAAAQMLPITPEPISTRELMAFADLMQLSDAQRLGLLSLHDEYRERYREFQSRDLDRYQNELFDTMREAMRVQSVPERDALEDLLRGLDRLRSRTRDLDEMLFSEMSGTLSEEQLEQLPRIRTLRERERYAMATDLFLRDLNRGVRVDLSELVMDLDRSPEEIELTRPVLVEYEATRLRLSKSIEAAMRDGLKVILDLIDELGIRDMDMAQMMELAQDEGLQARLMNMWDEESKSVQRRASSLSRLNLETFRRLVPHLSPENARLLRQLFYGSAYGNADAIERPWSSRYRDALSLRGLDNERRASIEEQLAQLEEEDARAIEEMIEAIERVRAYRTSAQLSREEDHPQQDRIDQAREQRRRLDDRADAALGDLLESQLVARLEEKRAQDAAARDAEVLAETTAAENTPSRRRRPPRETWIFGDERQLPAPVDESDMDRLVAALGWTESQGAIVVALRDDYDITYSALAEVAVAESGGDEGDGGDGEEDESGVRVEVEMGGEVELSVAEDGDETLSPRDRARLFRKTLDQLRELDDALFDDLRALASDEAEVPAIDRAQRRRKRRVATWVAEDIAMVFGSEEAYVDLDDLIAFDERLRETGPAVRRTLDGYEDVLTPMVDERLEAAIEAHSRFALIRTLSERGEGAQQMSEAVQEKWRDAQADVRSINREIIETNRSFLDQLLEELPDELDWDLRYGYNNAAFPDIFDEAAKSERLFATIRALDLSSDQRGRIDEIVLEYRTRYYAFSDRMVTLRRERDWDMSMTSFPNNELINREIELQRLRSERRDVDERVRVQIDLVLSDEQAQQVPGLRSARDRDD